MTSCLKKLEIAGDSNHAVWMATPAKTKLSAIWKCEWHSIGSKVEEALLRSS